LKEYTLYGLIGNPLTHSFSRKYFEDKFQKESIQHVGYMNFPLDNINLLPSLLMENPTMAGLNVTIPYKKSVLEFIDILDETAGEIGAVNTIKINRSGGKVILAGYNTDTYGFKQSLIPFLTRNEKKALILGTGGASEAVRYVLNDLGIEPLLVTRNPGSENQLKYEDLDHWIINDCQIIINTTPVGMYPDSENCPAIPYKALTDSHLLYDLIYNPELSRFLRKGREAGATIVNGMKMLEFQAERSWEIWNED